MKKLLTIIVAIISLIPFVSMAQTTIPGGGTGWSTSTPGDLLVGTSSTLRYSRLPIGTAGYVLQSSSTSPYKLEWVATSSLGISGGGGSGTVTSVALTTPTGLSISGSPITTSGTLAISLTSGYVIPLTASTTEWATAYASSSQILGLANTWSAAQTIANILTTTVKAIGSGGITFQSNNGTQVANFGAGGGSGATFSGQVNFATTSHERINLTGPLQDGTSATGTFGMVLQTTGTSTRWVATTTLGLAGSGQWTTSGSDIFYNSGRVAIGTGTPSVTLTVDGDASNIYAGNVLVTDTTAMGTGVGGRIALGGKYLTAGDTTTFASIAGIKENGTSGNYAGALVLSSRVNGGAMTEYLRINSSGNVGIGTTTPTSKLDVTSAGSVPATSYVAGQWVGTYTNNNGGSSIARLGIYSGPTGTSLLNFGSADADIGGLSYDNSDNSLAFRTNNSEWARITSSGNVGIGTTTPQQTLVVVGSTTISNLNTASCDVLADAKGGLYCGTNGGGGGSGTVNSGTATYVAYYDTTGTAVSGTSTITLSSNGPTISGYLGMSEISATPSTPSTNGGRLYLKDSGGVSHIYFLDDAGTETDLTTGGGGCTDLNCLSDVVLTSPTATTSLYYDGTFWRNGRLYMSDFLGVATTTQGGTGFGSYAVGDILYATTTTQLAKLAAGTDGYYLKLVSGKPAWGEAVDVTSTQTVSGVKTFNSFPQVSGTPSNGNDLINKTYADSLAAGFQFKAAITAGTTTQNITLSGVQNIDGVTGVSGDRVLIMGQTTTSQNGCYTQAAGAWSRCTDYDAAAEILQGTSFLILGGTSNGATQWAMNAASVTTVGTDPITFIQINKPSTFVGSAGVTVNGANVTANIASNGGVAVGGDSLYVKHDNSTLSTSTGFLAVKDGGITNVKIAAGTIDLTTKVTGTLPVANGGTNLTAASDDNVMVGNGTTWQSKALTSCTGATSALQYDTASNAFSCGTVSGGGGGGSIGTTSIAVNMLATAVTGTTHNWVNQPATSTEFGGGATTRLKVDLTGMTRYRIMVNLTSNTGSSNADLNLRYSTTNPALGTAYLPADTGGAGEVALNGTGILVGGWADLVAGAKGDVWINIIGKDGSGGGTVSYRQIMVEFQGPLGTGTVNSGTAGQVAYYASTGNAVSGTSTISIVGNRVSIGTTSPQYKLHVWDDADRILTVQRATTTLASSALINFANGIQGTLSNGYIGSVGNSGAGGSQTGYVDPNGDGSTLEFTPSTGTTHYTLVDDGTRSPSTPNTADYISESGGGFVTDEFAMSTLSNVASISQIKVYAYTGHDGSYSEVCLNIYVAGAWQTENCQATGGVPSWWSSTFTGTWTQADLDSLQIRVKKASDYGTNVAAAYAEITYTEASDSNLVFGTNPNPLVAASSTERMRINKNGLIGIATTTPNSTLTIVNATSTGDILSLASTTAAVLAKFNFLGHLTVPRIIGNSSAPTVATSTGAGTNSGSANLQTGSTDIAGTINVNVGTSPSTSATIVTLTFSRAYTQTPHCIYSDAKVPATSVYGTSTPTTFSLVTTGGSLNASTLYQFAYHCIQ